MSKELINYLKNNLKKKEYVRLTKTNDKNYQYNDFYYVDMRNKVVFSIVPRAGCTVSLKTYFELVGLLDDAERYNLNIHKYRQDIFHPNIKKINIEELIKQNFLFIKFITNPYRRIVSIYNFYNSHNYSFRIFLKKLLNNDIKEFTYGELFHSKSQYMENENNIIDKYIKINLNEKLNIKLFNNEIFEINPSKYTAVHHNKKYDIDEFYGDKPLKDVLKKMPKNYKLFYDDEIKKIVEKLFENDIKKYNFRFENI